MGNFRTGEIFRLTFLAAAISAATLSFLYKINRHFKLIARHSGGGLVAPKARLTGGVQ